MAALMFVSHLSWEGSWKGQGDQTGAAEGVQVRGLETPETEPGGRMESCLGGSLDRLARVGLGKDWVSRRTLRARLSQGHLSTRRPWPATQSSNSKASTSLGCSGAGCPGRAWPRGPLQQIGLSQAPRRGPRCPRRDPNRLTSPRGVRVIQSLCLLPW